MKLAAKTGDEFPEREREYVYACVQVYMNVYMCVYMCTCMHMRVSAYMCIYVYVYECLCTGVFSCVYVCVLEVSQRTAKKKSHCVFLWSWWPYCLNWYFIELSKCTRNNYPKIGRIHLSEALRTKLPGLLKIGCFQVDMSLMGFISTPGRFIPKHTNLVNHHWNQAISYGKYKNFCFQ